VNFDRLFSYHKEVAVKILVYLNRYFSNSNSIIVWCIFLLALALLLPSVTVQADTGPKPSMTFNLTYTIPEQPILDAQLIECEDATCAQGEALRQLGPQHFECDTATACDSLAYGYAENHKMVLTYADRVRESNIFQKKAFSAVYTVTVNDDNLEVKENFTPGSLCACPSAGIVTIVLEMLIAAFYFHTFGLPRHLVGWVPVASLITLPFVWFVFPILSLPDYARTGFAESFAVVVEAIFMYWISGRTLSLKHAVVLSFIMNAGSFTAGLLL
jgi:hypothetical protein